MYVYIYTYMYVWSICVHTERDRYTQNATHTHFLSGSKYMDALVQKQQDSYPQDQAGSL